VPVEPQQRPNAVLRGVAEIEQRDQDATAACSQRVRAQLTGEFVVHPLGGLHDQPRRAGAADTYRCTTPFQHN